MEEFELVTPEWLEAREREREWKRMEDAFVDFLGPDKRRRYARYILVQIAKSLDVPVETARELLLEARIHTLLEQASQEEGGLEELLSEKNRR